MDNESVGSYTVVDFHSCLKLETLNSLLLYLFLYEEM